MYSKPESFAI